MKKILFVINTMGTAGAEKALIELLKKTDRTKCPDKSGRTHIIGAGKCKAPE